MFLFRFFKKLIFLILFAFLVWWGANYKVNGRPLYQIVKGFVGSENFDQGWKDFKMFSGGLLKSLGEEIQEDVTEADKEELEKMIQKKVREKNGNGEY